MEMIIALSALLAISMAARYGMAMTRSASPTPALAFPVRMSRQDHWARATGIVELSLARAGNVVTRNAAAQRQLEAADYALHNLLGELSAVMAVTVASPLARPASMVPLPKPVRSALAA